MKHLTEFITNASKYPFETPGDPPRRWLMRQPTPDEAASGDSAYLITFRRVLNDKRLRDLAGGEESEIQREAYRRASAAEAIYMLPLLLETPEGAPAFDVASEESLAEFEALDPAIVIEMTRVYFDVVKLAISDAKKKSTTAFSSEPGSASSSANGRSPASSGTRPGRKS